jgi:CDP-glycerol glycerophosphotransferase (TagB/SpsB family)
MNPERVFISADHGLAIVYFLQSGVVPSLLYEGIEVVLLTDDELVEKINQRFGQPGLTIEGLQMKQARQYIEQVSPTTQWWLNFLRRVGASNKINVQALDSHVRQVEMEATGRRSSIIFLMKIAISALRRSSLIRQRLVDLQMHYTPPEPGLYGELFDRYQPSLVIASTPAWRIDRFLMREAWRRSVPTASVIVGWDNPSSYSLSGSKIDWITCWSEIQKEELVKGSDWDPNRVNVAGIPSYDGYFEHQWLISKDEYYRLHHLDPNRKLLSYACSFTTFSPSYQNIEALAHLVNSDELIEPCQLLIRLHPNHFLDDPLFAGERERIKKLAEESPHVHVVEPVPLGGELGYYSGEDMSEKSSMMAYSDIFLTVYSTMVVECSIHETPIISVCFDVPGGWNKPNRFYLPLSQIGGWPTHKRFIDSGAGRVAMDERELRDLINLYLRSPQEDVEKQRQFIRDECTYTDASAGRRTAGFILSLLKTK